MKTIRKQLDKFIAQNPMVKQARDYAFKCHRMTNHKYDGMSYSWHLILVAEYAFMFKDLIPEKDLPFVIAAAFCHDTIEDTRITYNDLLKATNETVADIVYCVTNEKGKNRKQRANRKYYDEMKQNENAWFVKLCDRLSNIEYSAEKESRLKSKFWRFWYKLNGMKMTSMLGAYLKEHLYFVDTMWNVKFSDMFKLMDDMLSKNNRFQLPSVI